MEFSLEDVQQLCAAALPLHISSAGSDASFSAPPTPPFSACTLAENASGATPSRIKRPRFTEGRGREVGRLEGEERLVVRGHSTCLSREKHGVAAGALFYKVEGEKHCIMRKAILDI
jgi:hypothetical protein